METTALTSKSTANQSTTKSKQILPDGTHIKTKTSIRTEPDGSSVTKKRTVTYPRTSEFAGQSVPNRKVVKTTIIRTNPRGEVCSEITTEEKISKNGSNLVSGDDDILPSIIRDESRVIVATNISQLEDGTSSLAVTKIILNHVDENPELQDVLQQRSSSPGITGSCPTSSQVLSSNHPKINPRGDTNRETGTNDVKILSINQQPLNTELHQRSEKVPCEGINSIKSPCLKIISDVEAAHPAQDCSNRNAVINLMIKHAAPSKRQMREEYGCMKDRMQNIFQNGDFPEMIDNSHNEPVPIGCLTSKSSQHDEEEIICDHTKNEWSTAAVTSGHQKHNISKTDNATGHHMVDAFDCNYNCPLFQSDSIENDVKLAMATPINVQEVDKPIYEATKYTPNLNQPLHRNMRLMAFTIMLLLMMGAIISLAVVYGAKAMQEEDEYKSTYIPMESTAAPTPTTERDIFSGVKETLEKEVLKRNATFNNMSRDDPRLLALDWLMHNDEMQLEEADTKLNQRYILALLAFQFDSPGWYSPQTNGSLWLKSKDECEWYGVHCVDHAVIGLDLCKSILCVIVVYFSLSRSDTIVVYSCISSYDKSDWRNSPRDQWASLHGTTRFL